MSNPFPGMDPYLEGPLWTTVHHNLVEEIARQLAPQLRPKYFAFTDQRIVVASPDPIEISPRSRLPDVGVYGVEPTQLGGASALVAAPLVLDALIPEAVPQSFVEIRDVQERQLVAAIEVLSPSNKRGEGLEDYRKKRRELLAGEVHFLEIDLLRIGERFPVAGPLPSVPYFVFLSRANCRPRIEIWPIPLEQSLPTVPVPLLPGDADVYLDLQLAFQTVYDLFGYDRGVDHSGPARVRLTDDQATWAEERLRAAGFRPDMPSLPSG